MRQSRLMSLVEAVANVAVGLLLAVTTQIVFFPILGVHALLGQNVRLAHLHGRVDRTKLPPETLVRGSTTEPCPEPRRRIGRT
jgi:hypothetical protein